jgi:hypothetical protein
MIIMDQGSWNVTPYSLAVKIYSASWWHNKRNNLFLDILMTIMNQVSWSMTPYSLAVKIHSASWWHNKRNNLFLDILMTIMNQVSWSMAPYSLAVNIYSTSWWHNKRKKFVPRYINPMTPNDPLYGPYRTGNLQTLHFIYLFNKYTYRIF